jgi:hypothetical protein
VPFAFSFISFLYTSGKSSETVDSHHELQAVYLASGTLTKDTETQGSRGAIYVQRSCTL